MNIVYNEDCIEVMKRYEDNFFDLAIVDPPYGNENQIKKNGSVGGWEKGKNFRKYYYTGWNKIPEQIYFNELFRVSKNQIIFGANFFIEQIKMNSPCWIIWDKKRDEDNFADAELAWTWFDSAVKIFRFRWNGMLQENMKDKEIRIHPNHKPIQLYSWILKNFSKETDKILDTHLGSGSSRISCDRAKRYFVGCEIDKTYFEAQEKRFKEYKQQTVLQF